jgi:hypothetical protein
MLSKQIIQRAYKLFKSLLGDVRVPLGGARAFVALQGLYIT